MSGKVVFEFASNAEGGCDKTTKPFLRESSLRKRSQGTGEFAAASKFKEGKHHCSISYTMPCRGFPNSRYLLF